MCFRLANLPQQGSASQLGMLPDAQVPHGSHISLLYVWRLISFSSAALRALLSLEDCFLTLPSCHGPGCLQRTHTPHIQRTHTPHIQHTQVGIKELGHLGVGGPPGLYLELGDDDGDEFDIGLSMDSPDAPQSPKVSNTYPNPHRRPCTAYPCNASRNIFHTNTYTFPSPHLSDYLPPSFGPRRASWATLRKGIVDWVVSRASDTHALGPIVRIAHPFLLRCRRHRKVASRVGVSRDRVWAWWTLLCGQ